MSLNPFETLSCIITELRELILYVKNTDITEIYQNESELIYI